MNSQLIVTRGADITPMLRNYIKTSRLGYIGEVLAESLLKQTGFKVRNLNESRKNHEDADFLASKDRETYFISVKARNKYTNKGELNPRYKLHSKSRSIEDAKKTARSYNAKYAWLTIQMDETTYSAYFGTHAKLPLFSPTGRKLNRKAVMMREVYTNGYLALAKNASHGYDYDEISNRPG